MNAFALASLLQAQVMKTFCNVMYLQHVPFWLLCLIQVMCFFSTTCALVNLCLYYMCGCAIGSVCIHNKCLLLQSVFNTKVQFGLYCLELSAAYSCLVLSNTRPQILCSILKACIIADTSRPSVASNQGHKLLLIHSIKLQFLILLHTVVYMFQIDIYWFKSAQMLGDKACWYSHSIKLVNLVNFTPESTTSSNTMPSNES